ncbi:MAG: FAD-dependent oxidoreductase [Gammaproteobacteria bacterium]|nr:FAD-dependent oxidoreductase [Gammaproteobacteria bacterium]
MTTADKPTMPYDIAIIGGGINGAACADHLSRSGFRVVVLEQYHQAGLATSSRSSKLIHGGLRYLETAQFRLVFESLQQRKYLLKHYPDLVKLLPFHIPVYTHSYRSSLMIRLGLSIYSLFSFKLFKTIKKSNWSQLDTLKTRGLKTVFQYYDAQTNDSLLTQKVMQQAQNNGTHLLTDACFISAECHEDRCEIKYHRQDKIHDLSSRIIINASGPWVNHILHNITPAQSQIDIELIAGTHIIVPGKLDQGMYYLEAPQDKRAVFVMPWKSQTGEDQILIGTTESLFTNLPEKVVPTENEIEYLRQVYNHYFSAPISRNEVIDAFAGLRVLPASNDSAFNRSRDTIIHHNNTKKPKVFSIYGGKLTAHRITAQQMSKMITPHM